MSQTEVVLYVAPGCGLCEHAREALRTLGVQFREVSDPRYALRVPVVELGGSIVAEGRIEVAMLRRALRRGRRAIRRR